MVGIAARVETTVGCWAAGGVVNLAGGLTVGLAVLHTLGCEVISQGGLGLDVVVVVAAVNIWQIKLFSSIELAGKLCNLIAR